jgi:hypothetical protein
VSIDAASQEPGLGAIGLVLTDYDNGLGRKGGVLGLCGMFAVCYFM